MNNLLITPAVDLTAEQENKLKERFRLSFIPTEMIPLKEQDLKFDLAEIDGIICNHFFTKNNPDILPNLKMVQLTSAGLDRAPVNYFKEHGISLFNAGDIYAVPIAEWVVCKVLDTYKKSFVFYRNQENHIWNKERDLQELCGATVSVVGFGNIGRQVAKRLKAFDTKVVAVDLYEPSCSEIFDEYFGIDNLEHALRMSDVTVLCLPLTEKTRYVINRHTLDMMKTDALLINPSRGGLICETDLIAHIKKNPRFRAALDVFENEPLPADSLLWNFSQIEVSPHNSFVSIKNKKRLFELILKNLSSFFGE